MIGARARKTLCLAVIALCALALIPLSSAQVAQSTPQSDAGGTTSAVIHESKGTQNYQPPPAIASEAAEYARAKHYLYFTDFVYGAALLCLLIQWRIAPRFRDWAERAGQGGFLQALIFTPCFVLVMDVMSLPLLVRGHEIARAFHQSVQGWGSWLVDWLKAEGVGIAIGTVLVWIFYFVIRKSPRRWWLYSWLALIPVMVFIAFAAPLWIEPLFFRYQPLALSQPALSGRIQILARHGGLDIPAAHIFEMSASAKLNSVNAYVTGVGASKRIVIWDTTIEKMTPPEVLFVVGHEMGHYVLNHVWKGIAIAAGAMLIFLFVSHRILSAVLEGTGRWGIRGPSDLASLPVLLLLLSIASFLATPLDNAISRYFEHQADQFGLEAIHGIVPHAPEAAASSLEVLGEIDLEEPNPTLLEKLWFYDHPPLGERIRFAENYDPWSRGQTPQFVK